VDILFLSHRVPYPPNKGDKIRSHALFEHLAKRHRIHLGCFIDDPEDFKHVDTIQKIAKGECLFLPLKPSAKWRKAPGAFLTGQPITTAYFGNPQISRWLSALVKTHRIDRTVVFSSAMAPYVFQEPALDPACTLLDMVDIDSDKWRQYALAARGPERWIFAREAETLLRLERKAARAFGATIFVSQYEADTFSAIAPETAPRVSAVTNGVDAARFAPGDFPDPFHAGEDAIVMVGRMDYRPNIDGAAWFAKEVMPSVARALPNARFHVVGADAPPSFVRAVAGPKVDVTGRVEDVRPYLQHAKAVVAPLRMARGVQNKVLEAMAMQKPVVATWEATRALSAVAEHDLWIENEPARFAQAVVAAARGQNRERIAHNGRVFVERHHNWERNLAGLDDLLEGLGGRPMGQAAKSAQGRFTPRTHAPSIASADG
jgi:sugar transferase (PEP-CTERM/EpsH1 system associated)